ncbi:MAG: radical SAM-associated putative lipoprotein [Paludibacteraceae bacterium]|nr:radical SAM-associated putative lipoprotein [Paludibacteraceae bacterium]
MKKDLLKLLNMLLASVLSIMGFPSCGDKESTDENGVEYGTPTAEFVFRGTVTDLEGNALPNVKVSHVYEHTYGDYVARHEDSLTSTDREGNYNAMCRHVYWKDGERLVFSTEDGAYVDTLMNYSDLAPLKGGNGKWFVGRSENTLDIKMNK